MFGDTRMSSYYNGDIHDIVSFGLVDIDLDDITSDNEMIFFLFRHFADWHSVYVSIPGNNCSVYTVCM